MKDLIVLVADVHAEWMLKTLLNDRRKALGLRDIDFEVIRHPRRDPGVFKEAPEFLRPYLRSCRYALVVFDREGSGREELDADGLARELQKRLDRGGWKGRAAVIVLDPELEAWVWSNSPEVSRVLGVSPERLRALLQPFLGEARGKPDRPKEALQAVLRHSGRPLSSSIFRQLAERVSLDRCRDPAFRRLRTKLQEWFSPQGGQGPRQATR